MWQKFIICRYPLDWKMSFCWIYTFTKGTEYYNFIIFNHKQISYTILLYIYKLCRRNRILHIRGMRNACINRIGHAPRLIYEQPNTMVTLGCAICNKEISWKWRIVSDYPTIKWGFTEWMYNGCGRRIDDRKMEKGMIVSSHTNNRFQPLEASEDLIHWQAWLFHQRCCICHSTIVFPPFIIKMRDGRPVIKGTELDIIQRMFLRSKSCKERKPHRTSSIEPG